MNNNIQSESTSTEKFNFYERGRFETKAYYPEKGTQFPNVSTFTDH